MGYSQPDHLLAADQIRFGTAEEVFQQDYVLVLRCPPEEQIRSMKPGACLISMLHYPTRPLVPNKMKILITKGYDHLSLHGDYFERALYRATLKHFLHTAPSQHKVHR